MSVSNIIRSLSVADAQAQDYLNLIDAGAGAGDLQLLDSGSVVLVTFPLSSPPGPPVVPGTGTAIITPPTQQNAIASGLPVICQFRDSDTNIILQDTVGDAASGYTQIGAATVNAGGTGYVVGDIVTLGTGTAIHPTRIARLEVLTVGGSGDVLTVGVSFPGAYNVDPTLVGATTTGGTGTGLTVDLTLEEHRPGLQGSGNTTVGLPVQIPSYSISTL